MKFFKTSRFTNLIKCDDCSYMTALKAKIPAGMTGLLHQINEAHAAHIVWQMFEVRGSCVGANGSLA